MTILGIDPGTASIGYGVIRVKKPKAIRCLGFGLIKTKLDRPFPERLRIISRELRKLIKIYRPTLMAIESVFFFKNLKTFIPVSRAEGVIILAAASHGIPVIEFSPPQIKARVTKNGRAEKKEVEKKIKQILNLSKIPGPDDVSDALAVALCAAMPPRQNRQ